VKNIAIRNSNIHGQGVFAEKDISPGEIIIDWSCCAEFLTNPEIEALPNDERKYLSFIDGRHILFKPPARFVNHSCNPNARGAKGHDVAIRHITQGDEITVDYVAEQVPGLNLQCNCGASGCRGFLKVDT
jgi:SET domain-containing protein